MVIQRRILDVSILNYFLCQSIGSFTWTVKAALDCLTLYLSNYLEKDISVISNICLTFSSQWNAMVRVLCWKSKRIYCIKSQTVFLHYIQLPRGLLTLLIQEVSGKSGEICKKSCQSNPAVEEQTFLWEVTFSYVRGKTERDQDSQI